MFKYVEQEKKTTKKNETLTPLLFDRKHILKLLPPLNGGGWKKMKTAEDEVHRLRENMSRDIEREKIRRTFERMFRKKKCVHQDL